MFKYRNGILKYYFLFLGLTIFLVACPDPQEVPEPINPTFWAAGFDTDYSEYYYQVFAILRSVGTYCKVYVEDAYSGSITDATIAAITSEFDNKVYNVMTAGFGPVSDVNHDQKIAILILDIKEALYTDGGGAIIGYFDSNHLFDFSDSNKRDMIFMDCNPFQPGSEQFNQTLAHELQHLINFNVNVFLEKGMPQDLWNNEGLSAAAEYLYLGHHVSMKIGYYNSDPYQEIARGQSFLSWGTKDANYGYYATVYLFFQWLRIHSGIGADLYKNIINHSAEDYIAVRDVVRAGFTDYYNTTTGWREILRDWYIANLFQNPKGIHGYKQDINLSTHFLSSIYKNTNFELFAGEGVYLSINGPATMDPASGGADIGYVGLNTNTKTISAEDGPLFSGNCLLCFNFNGTPNLAQNTALLPNIAFNPVAKSLLFSNSATGSPVSREIFPIDVIIGEGGKNSLENSNARY